MAPRLKRAQVSWSIRYGVLNGIISQLEKQNVETVTVTGMVSVRVLSRIQLRKQIAGVKHTTPTVCFRSKPPLLIPMKP